MTARATDPTAYLEANGYKVKREGRHLSVRDAQGDETHRVTKKNDGHYVWCDRYGNSGGDNISLVQDINPHAGYAEAVYQLAGAPSVSAPRQQQQQHRDPPSLPHQPPRAITAGRDYLKQRGISPETIEQAEKSGMVRYADGAVLFVGRDGNGAAQNVTRRAINPDDQVQKRDLKGSDKTYPPVLSGKTGTVWIVEGGADALATLDIAKRDKLDPPTVIVSGGANVRSFLENPQIQETLRKADKIVIVGEREKDAETQQRTDAGHNKQAARVKEIVGQRGEVVRWTPRGSKDLADFNLTEAREAQREAAPAQESMADKFIAEQKAAEKKQQPEARPQFTERPKRLEIIQADQRGKPLIVDDGTQVYITNRAMIGTGTRAEDRKKAVIERAQTEARLRYGVGKEQYDKASQQQRRERERMLERLHEKKKDKDKGRDDDLQL